MVQIFKNRRTYYFGNNNNHSNNCNNNNNNNNYNNRKSDNDKTNKRVRLKKVFYRKKFDNNDNSTEFEYEEVFQSDNEAPLNNSENVNCSANNNNNKNKKTRFSIRKIIPRFFFKNNTSDRLDNCDNKSIIKSGHILDNSDSSYRKVGKPKNDRGFKSILKNKSKDNNVRFFDSNYAAFQHVRDNLTDLNGKSGANETDLVFLKGLLDSPAVTQLIKIQDSFEELPRPEPVGLGNRELRREIAHRYSLSHNIIARELSRLFNSPHIKYLIDAHDEIGQRFVEEKNHPKLEKPNSIKILDSPTNDMPSETIKMVGLRRKPNEPLGLTVEIDEHKQLLVARILAGGMIDRQGLLHPGDVILEVNGVKVSTPEELQQQISLANESVTLKIGPNFEEEMKSARLVMSGGQVKNGTNLETGKKLTCYMRALFDYEPEYDTLLPCQEIGLPFKHGDILQIINVKDPNWWQAKHIGTNGPTGLIPSPELEERRKAYVPPEADFVHKIGICGTRISKKKKKFLYQSKSNSDFDKADLMLYEEVTKMPPFKRKTLVLIGVQGVGRRTLKNRIINSDHDKFGTVIPHTTRPPRVLEENGKGYWFTDTETMDQEIKENKFLEYGDHNGYVYGTHMDSVRDVIKQGRMCVLDCSPSVLKVLHNSPEFMPYVVFIGAPGMETLKQIYAERRATGSSRNLAFDRQSSIRYSSRRARTLESLASLYEDDDLVSTVEESALLQRKYEKYFDLTIINEDFDITFRKLIEALDSLSHEHQWVPVNWIY